MGAWLISAIGSVGERKSVGVCTLIRRRRRVRPTRRPRGPAPARQPRARSGRAARSEGTRARRATVRRGPVAFEPAHRPEPGLEPAVVGFHPAVGVAVGDVAGGGDELVEQAWNRPRPGRWSPRPARPPRSAHAGRTGEPPPGRGACTRRRRSPARTGRALGTGNATLRQPSRRSHRPTSGPRAGAGRPSGLDEQRGEPAHPPVHAGVIDLHHHRQGHRGAAEHRDRTDPGAGCCAGSTAPRLGGGQKHCQSEVGQPRRPPRGRADLLAQPDPTKHQHAGERPGDELPFILREVYLPNVPNATPGRVRSSWRGSMSWALVRLLVEAWSAPAA